MRRIVMNNDTKDMAPDAKRIRAPDMAVDPATGDLLASNVGAGWVTNGTLTFGIHTRVPFSRELVNAGQVLFLDSRERDEGAIMSACMVNRWIMENTATTLQDRRELAPFMHGPPGSIETLVRAQQRYLLDRFKLQGVVQNLETLGGRNTRVIECATFGKTMVFDYWSHDANTSGAYDTCYFILKRVPLPRTARFQTQLRSSYRDSGTQLPNNWDERMGLMWQIVPYFNNKRVPDAEVMYWDENRGNRLGHARGVPMRGTYWRLGYIHEDPTMDPVSMTRGRTDSGHTTRDVTMLTNLGQSSPVHFYLDMTTG